MYVARRLKFSQYAGTCLGVLNNPLKHPRHDGWRPVPEVYPTDAEHEKGM